MATLTDILSAMQNGVTAIQGLNKSLNAFFPQATTVSSGVTVGAITFNSSQAAGFLTVVTSSGAAVKVAVYNV